MITGQQNYNFLRIAIVSFAMAGLAILGGCSGARLSSGLPEAPKLTQQDVAGQKYMIGAGDQILVTVFGEKDLSGIYSIDPEGMLAMPLVAPIKASGQSLEQLEQSVFQAYDGDYLIEPRVSVSMHRFRPFFILGEVRSPGGYDYVHNMTVEQAVAIGGGMTYRGHRDDIVIRRKMPIHVDAKSETTLSPEDQERLDNSDMALTKDFRATMASRVYPGDTIEVGERFF